MTLQILPCTPPPPPRTTEGGYNVFFICIPKMSSKKSQNICGVVHVRKPKNVFSAYSLKSNFDQLNIV